MEQRVLEELFVLLKGGVSLSPTSVVLVAVSVLVASGVGAYLAEKAKGVATKEDVAEITRKVEDVRFLFSAREAEREQRYRLQLAVLDKRMAVHQEAYTRWRKLLNAVYTREVANVVVENQDWFHQNCVYLGRDLATAFHGSLAAAWVHRDLLRAGGTPAEEIQKNWDRLEGCGAAIMAAVDLPQLRPLPGEPVATTAPNSLG